MSLSYVKIHYGPYEAFHTVSHKPQKLEGLKSELQKEGFHVRLVPVQFINYCMLEVCGHEVFRCNIRNLKFNLPADQDPVCQRAVKAALNASAKFSLARRFFWSWSLIDQQLFLSNEFSPKYYSPVEVDLDMDAKFPCPCIMAGK